MTVHICNFSTQSRVHVLDAARNLSVLFDSQLSMSAQVSAVCRTGYTSSGSSVRLSEDDVKTVIQAFINTRLDYCNSLYFDIADGLMSRLQSVQNAAACLITESGGASTSRHCSPTSAALQAASPQLDEWNSRYSPSSIVRWLALLLCVPS